jgi:GrpB-like predicted nucleotidyltransferase (UPF0157 family)
MGSTVIWPSAMPSVPTPALAGVYGDLKRTLAARLGTDRAGHTEAKSAFIERVLAASPQRP